MPGRPKESSNEKRRRAGTLGGKTVLAKYGREFYSRIGKLGIKAAREGRDPKALPGGTLWVPGRYRVWLENVMKSLDAGEEKQYFLRSLRNLKVKPVQYTDSNRYTDLNEGDMTR